jgi:uncharacterized membrane protein
MADIDLSDSKGILAGMGAATVLPVAVLAAKRHLGGKLPGALFSAPIDGVEKLTGKVSDSVGSGVGDLTGKLGDSVGSSIGDKVTDKVDESGGLSGILKGALPFGGGDDGGDNEDDDEASGYGKGRRMPVQQSVDIGAPIETVYNQWTQFELWPKFMHRVTRVSQEDQCTVSFETKIWGKKKEFTAQIETQRPDERVKWTVSHGLTHTGVVTFHELGPRLTRVLLNMDVEPGGMLEKLARGARHVKRAARGDLHRFKAFVEMTEEETGAWRGVVEDGKVVQEHKDDGQSSGGGRGGSSGGSGRSASRGRQSRGRSGSSRSKAATSSRSSSQSSSGGSGSSGTSGSSRSSRRRQNH